MRIKTARTIVTLYGTNITPDYKATRFDNTNNKTNIFKGEETKRFIITTDEENEEETTYLIFKIFIRNEPDPFLSTKILR